MKADTSKRIPVNLVAGPLGVGKTTAVNHLLSHRPPNEKWAVLVNEYGLVGLDAALLAEAADRPGVQVREVAGGCICCSAGFMFEVSLVLLLQRRPDRLLIEPTGLATVSGIMDTLARPGIREAVDVRSVVSMLDPTKYERDLHRVEVQNQVEAADILLANRSDLASIEQIEAFESWAKHIFPPKRYVGRIERGKISVELLDLVSERVFEETGADHDHDHDHDHDEHQHRHDHGAGSTVDSSSTDELKCGPSQPIVRRAHRAPVASTVGWVCWDGLVFDSERSARWLGELSIRPGIRRAKAVLRTTEGWWSFNMAEGVEEVRPSGHRRDSRLELVIEGDSPLQPDDFERSLRDCLVSPLPVPG